MEINFSNEVKAVLENSRKEAIRHNNSIITPEHLFLALLADTGSRVFALLERVSRGASVYQLRQQLDDSLYDATAPLGGEVVASLGPERRVYEKFGAMQFSEVDVATGPGGDIYASLLGLDEDLKVLVRVSLEPMVSWIWLGGWLMCLLPLLGLWRRRPARIAQ